MLKKYLVWCPEHNEGPEEAIPIDAYDPADAAEQWAEQEDRRQECRNSIARGESVTVVVRFVATESQRTYSVSAVSVTAYTATEVRQ